jgi:pyrroline-5-carboxylate reductase
LGVTVFTNNKDIVLYSDVIVIAVKPHQVLSVLDELKEIFKGFTQNKSSIGTNVMPKNMRPLIVSVATAVTLKQLEEKTEVSWNMSGQSMEGHLPVVRCLPTLACSVRAGVTAYTSGRYCNEQNLKNFLTIFNTCGHSEEVPESYIDGFTSFSGSGIAFMGLVLEALSDGGVLVGLPRPMADRVAAHTMMSTAKLIIESGLSPAEVRTRVASPGGTTIHGLKVMEEKGVRGAVMDAVLRATQRAKELQPK